MREEVLRLERVTCLEQGVVQLENFNLQIFRGEIMGLLAVNSHGLNTLLHLLRRKLPLERAISITGSGRSTPGTTRCPTTRYSASASSRTAAPWYPA